MATLRTFPNLLAAAMLGVAAFTYTPARLDAQFLDPDRCLTCRDKLEHAAAGAAVGVVVRGPWFAESWRDHAWKRVGLVAVLGATYEYFQYLEHKALGRLGQTGFGFSFLDIGADIAGSIALELIVGAGRAIW